MFGDFIVPIRVRLKCDLTHYCEGLTAGLLGYTYGNVLKGDSYTSVIYVHFDNGVSASIVLDKLEIIDEEYISFLKKREKQFLKSLENASDILKEVSSTGKFKELSFTCEFGAITIHDKTKALRVEEKLKKLKKKIQEKEI